MKLDPRHWPINDDAESELRFWVQELYGSLKCGTVSALVAGLLIALVLDEAGGRPIGDWWPVLVEFAFWLGMFAGLLWGGSKRLGIALAAGLPWRKPRDERAERARFFGQWAAFSVCIAFFLWLAAEMAPATGMPAAATLVAALWPVQAACRAAGLLFGVIALLSRRAAKPGERSQRVLPD